MKTPRKTKQVTPALTAAFVLFFSVSLASAQVIHLEKTAVVESGQDVRLGNVATIQGADARTTTALANTVILPGVQGPHKIGADSILMAVVAQLGPGGVSNDLQMSGSDACDITIDAPVPAVMPILAEPVSQHTVPPAESNAPSVITASVASEIAPPHAQNQTLAQTISALIGSSLHLPPDQFRIDFETENLYLDQPAPAGSGWQCRPLTRTFLGTVPISSELIQGTHVLHRVTIQAHVEKKSQVLVAAKQIHMGDIITSDCYQAQELWLDQNLPTLFTKDAGSDESEVIGLEAKRDLSIGSQLDQRDFKPAEMAKQGDMVSVYFIAGSLKVQMSGRALKSGKFHDQIPLKNEKTGETYDALLIGKNLAVVGGKLTHAQEKMLQEMQ